MAQVKNTHSPRNSVSAIGLLLVGLAALGAQDVVMKNLSPRFSVFELLLIRGLFALLIFQVGLLFFGGKNVLRTERLGLQLLRGILLFGALACYYIALSSMPLLETAAIFFTGPIFATVLSAVILKEVVSIGRWLAVVVGFIGVLLIIRPEGTGIVFHAALFALTAALLYASSLVTTRRLGNFDPAVTTATYSMLSYIILATIGSIVAHLIALNGYSSGTLALVRSWRWPELIELFWLFLAGFGVSVGFFCLAEAYRRAVVSVLAVWEYSSLILAGIIGFLVWSEVPTWVSLGGAVLIILSGVYAARARP